MVIAAARHLAALYSQSLFNTLESEKAMYIDTYTDTHNLSQTSFRFLVGLPAIRTTRLIPYAPLPIHLDKAMSSILRIIFTVSAASSIMLVLTSSGCRTFSSVMSSLTPPLRMLTPALC